MLDPYSAVWVSHSSLSDFINCPRAYYLKNVYKDSKTGRKIQLVGPALVLGLAVHQVLESRSKLPVKNRFEQSLIEQYEEVWKLYSGREGGFTSGEQEARYKERGAQMLRNVMANPGPVGKLSIKVQVDLPHYWLSQQDGIILCGKIDWLEYVPEADGVRIIDFKTGKHRENGSSLQLPIYHLLVHNVQHRTVVGASYWYLEQPDGLLEKELPALTEAHDQVLSLAKQVKLARKLERFKCPEGSLGCRYCQPYESILRHEAEFICVRDRRDVYSLGSEKSEVGVFESELI